jgi:hypothetical protein
MRKVQSLAVFLLVTTIFSCSKKYEEIIPENSDEIPVSVNYRVYTIPAGEHSSVKTVRRFLGKSMEFEALFDKSAIYSSQQKSNQGDINKLYGFSDCNSAHHVNSARFGWNCLNGRIAIFAYTYVEKNRESVFIKSVDLNTSHKYKIEIDGSKYKFTVDEKTVEMRRGCNSSYATGYCLFPYFGGDETAPHEIKIYIKS